jgi:phage FluMu gp28-like protein
MSREITAAEWAASRRAALAVMPEIAAEVGLPAVFLPYQQAAQRLLDTASVVVVEKSRRIGLTWALAGSAVLAAAAGRAAGGMDALYISYSKEMTREFIDACAMWGRVFALAAIEEGEFVFTDVDPKTPDDTRDIQAFRIRFASGFEIVALSSAPRSLRGKQGLCLIDEAAFVDSLRELLKAALAFLMWGGKVVVCSTHNGAGNAFNELVQDVLSGRRPYAHLKIDFDEALRDGLYRRICLVTGRAWSPEAEAKWREDIVAAYGEGADEELFCVPSDGEGVWLASTLIEARMTEKAGDRLIRSDLPPDFLARGATERLGLITAVEGRVDRALAQLDNRVHAVGFDFARRRDLSVITVLAIAPDLRRVEVLTVELRRWPYSEQGALMTRILRGLPRWQAALVDATGEGGAVAEAVQRACGDRVVAVRLSSEWYRLNMPRLKRDFEDGMIGLIRDAEHRDDLRLVRVVRGVPIVPDERTGAAGAKRHGDFAIALALAHAAALTEPVSYGYDAVPLTVLSLDGAARSDGFWRPRHDDEPARPRDLRGII